MAETEAATAATLRTEDWVQAPWRKLEQHVYRLQKRIYRAQSRGNTKAVHSLQRLLMKSRAAGMLAVRRVSQDNQGKQTAGVDGVKSIGPTTRLYLVDRLRTPATITARPVRRVLIPKPGKPNEFRPLGIPVMLDRAHQALVKLALEPQWEARFEPNSYGFRPGRSCQDAVQAIFTLIATKAKYVLDADIKGCFDNINHHDLLHKLDSTPTICRAVKAWLEAGVLLDGVYTPSSSGTPQGGVISPLLANIALHGLEELAARAYRGRKGLPIARPSLIRYADDFVVLCADLEGILAARAAVETWLAARGLHLNPEKTRVTHTLHPHEGHVGFDFLGFTIRQYPTGKHRCGRSTRGTLLGFKTLIRPSKKAIKHHVARTAEIIREHRAAPQHALIGRLNPVIRGWSRYYRTVAAAGTFTACDSHLFAQLWRWATHRHPRKGKKWLARRYWSFRPGHLWTFTVTNGEAAGLALSKHAATPITRQVKVRGTASPYDGNLPYWATRLRAHPLTKSTLGKLLARQQGRCSRCGLTFTSEDSIDVDHVSAERDGGTDTLDNKQALHNHCHDQKTADDRTRRLRTG